MSETGEGMLKEREPHAVTKEIDSQDFVSHYMDALMVMLET